MGIGAKAYFALENLPKNGVLVVVTPEDYMSTWHESLQALGQISASPQILLFPSSDQFERITTLNKIAASPSGIIITSNSAISKKTFEPDTLRGARLFSRTRK